MDSLYDKVRELEQKYQIKSAQQIERNCNLKLIFPKKYKEKKEFLEELKDFNFTHYQDNFDSESYYSSLIEESIATKLKKIIDIKIRLITKDYYSDSSFDSCIKRYNNNINTYIEYNKKEVPDNKMFDYYSKSLELEQRMLNTDFKKNFCNELTNVLKDCLDYKSLSRDILTAINYRAS